MCGITGLLTIQSTSYPYLSKVTQSTEKLLRRGPDHGDVYLDENCALGHRRLSILDTSDGASQPMKDVSGRYVIVFNGEIFNFQHLKDQHLSKTLDRIGGLKTTSDTEVLLYLLIEYREQCLTWLNGFFAFAFYDTVQKELLLGRDRFGKKPLLWFRDASFFAFASEMKALLEWDIPRQLDYTTLYTYLQLNYIPQPESMIAGVRKLMPGHYMKVGDGNKIICYEQYYKLELNPADYQNYTYDQAQEELVSKMDEAVQERMIADVPLGAFLSGGIDSSIIVALASRYTQQLNTFSIGYKDHPFFDETRYAQLVAKKYGTNHTVFSLGNADFLEHVHDVLAYLDEPFADSSAIPVYILSMYTRKHVTVALSGDGGDEVFGGYNKHAAEWRMRQNSIKNKIVKAGYPVWAALPKSRNHKLTNTFRQLHRFAEGARLSMKDRYWRWAAFNSPRRAYHYFTNDVRDKIVHDKFWTFRETLLGTLSESDFNSVLLTDMNLVLLSDMLVKVDLMSMANSLEVRSPFLDYRVVDLAFGLPAEFKIDASMKKKIVQDAFRPMLPPELYNRPKQGFEIPLLDWFKKELWSLIDADLLQKDFVAEQGIFNVAATEALKQKMRSRNPEDSHATIWALIVFQSWWKRFIG